SEDDVREAVLVDVVVQAEAERGVDLGLERLDRFGRGVGGGRESLHLRGGRCELRKHLSVRGTGSRRVLERAVARVAQTRGRGGTEIDLAQQKGLPQPPRPRDLLP